MYYVVHCFCTDYMYLYIRLPVSAMIMKQGNNFTTAKIVKKVCKTLFVMPSVH